jgi:hypothetical protein
MERNFACELAGFDLSLVEIDPSVSFLDMFQVESKAQNPPGRLSYRGLAIGRGLRSKAVAPYWHVARSVGSHFGLPINFMVYLPKGKLAAVASCQYPEISRLHG